MHTRDPRGGEGRGREGQRGRDGQREVEKGSEGQREAKRVRETGRSLQFIGYSTYLLAEFQTREILCQKNKTKPKQKYSQGVQCRRTTITGSSGLHLHIHICTCAPYYTWACTHLCTHTMWAKYPISKSPSEDAKLIFLLSIHQLLLAASLGRGRSTAILKSAAHFPEWSVPRCGARVRST